MNRWITTGGAAALSLLVASCSKPTTSSEEDAPDEPVASPSTPTPAVTDTAPEVAAAATPAPKRLAPDGTFFLLAKKSVETDAGIVGLNPGTRVTRRPDGKFLGDGIVVDLQPHEITNDLDVAGRTAGADARAQAAIRQTLAARAAAASAASVPVKEAAKASSSSSRSDAPASSAPISTGLTGTSSMGSAHTRTKDGWLWEKNSEGYWERVRPLR